MTSSTPSHEPQMHAGRSQPIVQSGPSSAASSPLQHQVPPDVRSSTMQQPLQPLIAPRPEQAEPTDPAQNAATPGPAVPITEQEVGEYREQDRYLPIANVSRIMKSSVPPTAKIAKDAKECVQECVSEFISFITSEAAEKCSLEKRKTIGGEDILQALGTLGFDNYAQTLKIHLAKLRQHQNGVTAEQKNGQRHEEDSPQ